MCDKFLDQAIEGILATGETVELARWSSDSSEYDAPGWMESFGERVGSGTAQLPDQSCADLSKFCVIRPVARVP